MTEDEIRNINDPIWGPIDPSVIDVVIALNEIGIETLGSCEGHIEKESPSPCVDIKNISPEDFKKLQDLIDNFNSSRNLKEDERITIETHDGITVIGNGTLYMKRLWNELEANPPLEPKNWITDSDRAWREKNLPILQGIMKDFAVYIRSIIK